VGCSNKKIHLLLQKEKKIKKFRHTAGFGKRIEHWIIGKMLKEGLDVYVPIVDDYGIDAVIRKSNGSFVEIQIKARSNDVLFGDIGLFAGITHEKRKNYFFVFYAERIDKMWIMSSEEFIKEANQNKAGKNKGKRSIWLNGIKKDIVSEKRVEYPKAKFVKYLSKNFNRFK
jgi:predicted helicase